MPINPKNLVKHELIGLSVKIKDSTNKSHIGMEGCVIDESYNMLKIETKKGEKMIPKSTSVFIFQLPDKTKVEVDGKILVGRPEDRIKKKLPRW